MNDDLEATLAAGECPVCGKAFTDRTNRLERTGLRRDVSLPTGDYERVCLFETGVSDAVFFHEHAPSGGKA